MQDKVVLLTGASSGIGRATAIRLAKKGARIALASRTVPLLEEIAEEVRRFGTSALVVPLDVTDRDQCRHAVEATVGEFGKLDILLCSAGVSMRSEFGQTDLDALEKVMQVNFYGAMYCTYFAIPHVIKTRGSLVALSSLTGKRGIPSYSIYGASKFALQGLYESIRLELSPRGVHVGIFASGFVDTPLRERVLGPDGNPLPTSPILPFRVWPLEKVVDALVRQIVQRKREVLFPRFVRPLLALDTLVGGKLGDRYLMRKFKVGGTSKEEWRLEEGDSITNKEE
jgi:NAD(P)-dependent dehydrogenase (short-subunit alcohol dehydrogenase family)